MGRVTWIVSAVLYLGVIVWGWLVLPADGVAAHMSLSGEVTRYGSRAEFVGTNLGLALLMLGITPALSSAATRGDASMLNMPNKDYWLQPERREATLSLVRTQLWYFLAATNLLIAVMMADIVAISILGRDVVGPWMLALYLVGTIIWTVWFTRRFRRPEDA